MGLFFSRMRRDPLFCLLAALFFLWIAAMFAVPPLLTYDAYTNDTGARLYRNFTRGFRRKFNKRRADHPFAKQSGA